MKNSDKDQFKNKVLRRLGLKNIEQLQKAVKYNLKTYAKDQKGYFYLEVTSDLISSVRKIVSKENSIFPREIHLKKNEHAKPIKWTVYLSKKPNAIFLPHLKREHFRRKKPVHTYPNSEIYLDKGHLVAKSFKNFISSDILSQNPQSQSIDFFCKDKRSNIIYQFENVNRNEDKSFGQLYFEQKVEHMVDKGTNIFYQIEPIFYDKKDLIPIGTRLLAFQDENRKEKFNSNLKEIDVPFHVFIPNCSKKALFNPNDPEELCKYRHFYKTGD